MGKNKCLSLLYDFINRLTGMRPINPADLRRKAKYFDLIHDASVNVLYGLGCFNCKEYEDAERYITNGIEILESRHEGEV